MTIIESKIFIFSKNLPRKMDIASFFVADFLDMGLFGVEPGHQRHHSQIRACSGSQDQDKENSELVLENRDETFYSYLPSVKK